MKSKSSNKNLHKAGKAKKDEFYTQLVDIEKELMHYKDQFHGKIVYCNCDDPFESNFFKYFAANFNVLNLKKLITTSYVKSPIVGGQIPLFEVEGLKPSGKEPFKIEIKEVPDTDGDGAVNLDDVKYLLKHNKNTAAPLKGNGDFRSYECIELLKKADIVVTNPPFSLFRKYVAQLIKYKKKFLIMGNQNAITYKEIFKLIKEDKIWLGQSLNGRNILFQIPDYYESYYKIIDGKKYAFPKGVVWFTNLNVPKRREEIVLYKKYSKQEYHTYDNYQAINIDRTEQIPQDYDGNMGVPITFLHKYNPLQFQIIALGIVGSIDFAKNKRMEILKQGKPTGKFTMNAKGTLYRKYSPKKDAYPAFKDVETGELYSSIYARIIIKNKKLKKII